MVPFLVMALVSSVLLIRIRRRRDKKRNGDQQFVGVRARWPLARAFHHEVTCQSPQLSYLGNEFNMYGCMVEMI